MPKCNECGQPFDVDSAREDFDAAFPDGDLDYDEETHGTICASCIITRFEGLVDQGRAIDMMNGEEDYDADFVEKNL